MTPRGGARTVSVWALAVAPTVLAPMLLLLVLNPRYLFYGDTQSAYVGWEYYLGEQLRAGNWPLVDPHAWQAGNLVAEGQAGLFSPMVMAIGLLATVSGNMLLFATVMKLALLCVGATGVFALARSYQVAAPFAYVAAVAAPLGGMSQYLDMPSWVAALMIWALLPWVWWALRRTMLAGANPFPALLLGYLLVTVGYVYGTIMLILVLGACLVDCLVARDRAAAVRVLGVGAVCGLVAVTVYLPGVLTASVTRRADPPVDVTDKFTTDPLALVTSILPTAAVPGVTEHVLPYAYVVWFLPVLLWLDPDRLRRGWRPAAGLCVMTLLTLLVVVGPSQVGPLRWPLRLQPFLVQALVVVCAVGLGRYAVHRPSQWRLLVSLAWVLLAVLVAVLRRLGGWEEVAVSAAVVAAGLAVLWLVLRRRTPSGWALPVVAVAFTLTLTVIQHGYFPDPPSPDRNLPAQAADYRRPLGEARGDVMVVGHAGRLLVADPSASRDFLSGSAWYLNPHPVRNSYTTFGFQLFYDRFHIRSAGSTHPDVLKTLFTREPTTGARRVDLLAVSTLLMVRADFPDGWLDSPPSGWRVADSTAHAVTWVRRQPVPGAGRPVWTSEGTSVSLVSVDHRGARFTVDEVPARGGRVVLSALAWPGYRTDTGSLGAPLDGYLVNVRLPADSSGSTVSVRFSPPGWPVEVASWWLAVAAGLVWSVAVRRRRPR